MVRIIRNNMPVQQPMTPEEQQAARVAALQHLKDIGMFDPSTDNPQGIMDTPAEHLQNALAQHKKDLEDAMKYNGQ